VVPQGVLSSKIRSALALSGLKWVTFIMMTVVTTRLNAVTATWMMRSVGHGRAAHATGRRNSRRTARCTHVGPAGPVSGSSSAASPGSTGRSSSDVRSGASTAPPSSGAAS
jgi:hypothetical protein